MASDRPYLLINIIIAGLIGLVFIYSGIFSADKDNHPIPSFFEEFTGHASPSSGMSRAFSEIIRGDLESARHFNPDSLPVFAFFFIQLLQRSAVIIFLLKSRVQKNQLMTADVILTVLLFLYCFSGQIRAMLELML